MSDIVNDIENAVEEAVETVETVAKKVKKMFFNFTELNKFFRECEMDINIFKEALKSAKEIKETVESYLELLNAGDIDFGANEIDEKDLSKAIVNSKMSVTENINKLVKFAEVTEENAKKVENTIRQVLKHTYKTNVLVGLKKK